MRSPQVTIILKLLISKLRSSLSVSHNHLNHFFDSRFLDNVEEYNINLRCVNSQFSILKTV